MNTFVIPIMLSRLGWTTFIVFGCFNIGELYSLFHLPDISPNKISTVSLPIVWLIYPEVSGRSLEEVNLLFTSSSFLVGPNMKEYHRLVDEAGGNFAVAERRLFDSVDAEVAETDARTMSYSAEESKTGLHFETKSDTS